MRKIRIAIAGVGNCASSLIQGLEYYKNDTDSAKSGLMHQEIGGYTCGDITYVAAFDVDRRKVGSPVERAIFAQPNCATVFQEEIPVSGVLVSMGPILDGIASHMFEHAEGQAFRPANQEPVDIANVLRATKSEVLVCYLPVGSERAVHHYAEACLTAGVAMVNCVPVFIASDRLWAEKFSKAGFPVIGDDIKSQLGATIVHRLLTKLFCDRGVSIDHTYQLNTGGNSDFLNMLASERLVSKKASKTESVQSQLDKRLNNRDIHIGPSDYVAWQEDNKHCYICIRGHGFGNAPVEIDLKLSVQDSPNSAGVVIDAIRCAKLALERGHVGPIESVSACYMKSPPVQMSDSEAQRLTRQFLDGVEW